MSKVSLRDYSLEQLDGVHPEVTELDYRCDDESPAWADLARAFPNLQILDFRFRYSDEARVLDAELFRHFPWLKHLRCAGYTLSLEGLEPAQMTRLESITSAFTEDGHLLSQLAALPSLKRLHLDVDSEELVLEAPQGCALEDLQLRGESLKRVAFNLTNAAGLKKLMLFRSSYNSEPEAMVVEQVLLPASLEKLCLSPDGPVHFQAAIDAADATPKEVRIESSKLTVADGGLIRAKRIGELHVNLGQQGERVPDDMLRGIGHLDQLLLLPQQAEYNLAALLAPVPMITSLRLHGEGEGQGTVGDLRLPELGYAYVTGVSMAKLDSLRHSPKLASLDLRDAGCLADSQLLAALPGLTSLELDGIEDSELPQALRSHSGLQSLSLHNGQLQRLGDLSAMTGLTEVAINQYSWHGPCGALPNLDDLAGAPALTQLRLEVTPSEGDQTDILMRLPERIELTLWVHDHVARTEHLNKRRDILLQAHLTEAQRVAYWRALYLAHKPKDLPPMEGRFYLTFLEAKYNPFKKLALAWLRQCAEQAVARRPLGRDSVLFLCGKSGFKATELKAKAEELGFAISKKLDDSVTHVLLGSNPKQTHKLNPEQDLIIDDAALQQWFEQAAPQFLQQASAIDSGMVDTVMSMLQSPDEGAHKVAVEMLAQGGVTEAMHMPLFLILKTTGDKGLRKSIQQLLTGHGDESFQLAVGDRVFFEEELRGLCYEGHPKGEGPMHKKLKGLPKRWGRELCIDFSKAYFDRFGEGLLWLLTQKEECPRRRAIIAELVEGERLNWNRGCGFNKVLEGGDDDFIINCHGSPEIYMQHQFDLGSPKTRLPEYLPAETTITELDLHNCYLGALPAGFECYLDVKKLNLNFNHLDKLPAKLAKMTELEELDLSYNHLEEFPKVLFKLKNLKKLDLRRAAEPLYRWDYDADKGYESIRAPQKFRDAFPQCEILEDE